jgi:hypothetical protein
LHLLSLFNQICMVSDHSQCIFDARRQGHLCTFRVNRLPSLSKPTLYRKRTESRRIKLVIYEVLLRWRAGGRLGGGQICGEYYVSKRGLFCGFVDGVEEVEGFGAALLVEDQNPWARTMKVSDEFIICDEEGLTCRESRP